MTTHLSSQEFVNAIDQTLTPARQEHVAACASCRTQVEELRALVEEAGHGAAVPEPSPLFWDHFQARVLEAVAAEGVPPSREVWWKAWVRPGATLAASAAALAMVTGFAVYMGRPAAPAPDAMAVEAEFVDEANIAEATDAEWTFVTNVMGTLETDDVHEVLAPSRDAVDAVFETLTSDERDRFMKLLKAGMAEGMDQ
jgi:hypothetical protein